MKHKKIASELDDFLELAKVETLLAQGKRIPNKGVSNLKNAALAAARLVGEDCKGKDGLVGYLSQVAKKYPVTFVRLLAGLIRLSELNDKTTTAILLDPRKLAAMSRLDKDKLEAALDELSAEAKADPAEFEALLKEGEGGAGRKDNS